jgi:soluble lytic murein transglycosylase
MKSRVKFYIWVAAFLVFTVFVYFFLGSIIADAAYPLKYKDLIKKYSERFGVNPNLVAGLIYTESHFNASAGSPVGARGLMQIMPATGAGLARQLGESTTFSTSKLNDPDTSIRLGTYYIAQLINKYQGNTELGLIAYNGGVAAADRYATYGGGLVNETYQYRYKVINAKGVYDQLYGEWWKGSIDETTPTTGITSIVQQVKQAVAPNSVKPTTPKKPTIVDVIFAWLIGRKN